MNNYNLMRAAGLAIEFLAGEGRLLAGVAWCESSAPILSWFLSEEEDNWAWDCVDISPALFTRLTDGARTALGIVIAKWDTALALGTWDCAPIDAMLEELEETPEGSPLDCAFNSVVRGAAEHLTIVAEELAAREARELATTIPQSQPATARNSGRL